MGRPRAYDETTRERLLRAAADRLVQGGPATLTVRAVAADVGATTRAVYSLFGSKEGLVRALYVEGFAALDTALRAVPSTHDPLADLRALGFAYRESALARPHLYPVMFEAPLPELVLTEDDVALALGTLAVLQEAVRRCVDAGLLVGDPEAITRQEWALVHGLASLELRGALGDGSEARRHWDEAMRASGRGRAPH